jgi:hypothetical protein
MESNDDVIKLMHEQDEGVMHIDDIIAKSRQIVSDSLELTKCTQDKLKLPFVVKEQSSYCSRRLRAYKCLQMGCRCVEGVSRS